MIMTSDISELYLNEDGLGLGKLVCQGEISALELVEESIRRIEAINPALNAVIHKAYDSAREIARGPLPDGPFKGVPFLLKELATMWEGQPATNSCRYLKDFVAPLDMVIVTRIKQAGFILVGKSNAPELQQADHPADRVSLWLPEWCRWLRHRTEPVRFGFPRQTTVLSV